MKTSIRTLAMMALGLVLLATTGCSKLRARDQLNKGVQSYKNAKYEEAINHFQQAVSLDPSLVNARLYLATAYAQQVIQGVDTPENLQNAQQAIDQYKEVLERDPKNINSVKGIAYLYLQIKKFDDAKTFYRKAIDLDPNDPEPYYSVAVIDWTQSYQPRMEERAKVGLKPDEWIMKEKGNKKVCEMLREKNSGVIQDGIAMLQLGQRILRRPTSGWTRPWPPRRSRPRGSLAIRALPCQASRDAVNSLANESPFPHGRGF